MTSIPNAISEYSFCKNASHPILKKRSAYGWNMNCTIHQYINRNSKEFLSGRTRLRPRAEATVCLGSSEGDRQWVKGQAVHRWKYFVPL